MDLGLKGKRALVAGASKGLGFAVANALAAEGCDLAICARSPEPLGRAAGKIAEQHGVRVWHQAFDLTAPGAARDFAKEAMADGKLDILVTNAGGPPAGGFGDFDEEDWRRAVELTLLPAQALVRAVLPSMLEQGWGRIINMASISVKQPVAGLMLSNSIRLAVIGWAKSLADEVAGRGVTVNNICPGWFLTERVDELMAHRAGAQGISPEQAAASVIAAIPAGRMGDPQEFGDLAAFLASQRAGYINGASYWIDGGLYRGAL